MTKILQQSAAVTLGAIKFLWLAISNEYFHSTSPSQTNIFTTSTNITADFPSKSVYVDPINYHAIVFESRVKSKTCDNCRVRR